ncbi:MAG: Thioredoxin reductase [Firmicutes bacterium ADurb.Bin262]|nr:MAG: Thioredoxin reductase [Firmicutes bacterium ADurb.Bin262]
MREPDVLILGGGPAGLTAAIYAARAKLAVTLLETVTAGGQLRDTVAIENYPGFQSVTGEELAGRMAEQAKRLGAEIIGFSPVLSVSLAAGVKTVQTKKASYRPKAVIIATGAVPKKLPIPNEAKFAGRGIHYCATCDGALYENSVVGVVGGGNSALEEALFLTNFASKVIMIRRRGYFNGAASTFEAVMNHPKIEVLFHRDLLDVSGGDSVESALVVDTRTGEKTGIALSAVFGYIGTEPKTALFRRDIALDEQGYILTDETLRTNVPGVFAAGDVRVKAVRQITTAVADGTVAALNAEKYIKQGQNMAGA